MEKSADIIDFTRICRLCMVEESSMSSLFCEDTGLVPLPLRIMACVSIEISTNDGLPTQICNNCLCQVDGWYKFKDLCESADATLRKLLISEPVPFQSITDIHTAAQNVKKLFVPSQYQIERDETDIQVETNDDHKNVTTLEIKLEDLQPICHEARTSADEIDELLKTDGELIQLLPLENNGSDIENFNDDYSSDDCLSLIKERLLKEKKRKTRKKVKISPADSMKMTRTVQLQSNEDDFEFTVISFGDGDIGNDNVTKTKNKRCQTQGGNPKPKKRFRIRPAIPSACNLCDKVYKNSEILRQHMKSHHVSGNIECPHCQIKFVSLRSLKYHEQRKHSNIEPVPCSVCGKKFLDKKYLRVHENIHSQNNQYVCQFCGRKFIMKTNLTVHISRHHTQKTNDFICQICGKAFPFKLYLKKHFKTHTDYKPHSCSYCEARFRESTLLRKHVNSIHLKLRPFLCQYCQKTFTRGLYLREHMESQHLGIPRKVECLRCGETFHNRGKLRQHDCENRIDFPP